MEITYVNHICKFTPNACARAVNESPIIIEYARTVRKHIEVIPAFMNTADFGSTDLALWVKILVKL